MDIKTSLIRAYRLTNGRRLSESAGHANVYENLPKMQDSTSGEIS
jgi:hypothetical protein